MRKEAGFTLIEVLMTIVVISILAVVSISTITQTTEESRYRETLQEMTELRNILIGDPQIKGPSGFRTDFGYLGDMGNIPPIPVAGGLAALNNNYNGSVYDAYGGVRFGYGWNGPYIRTLFSSTDYLTDAWGTAYVYDLTSNPKRITSYGSDRAAGTTAGDVYSQDFSIFLPDEAMFTKIHGLITQGAAPADLPYGGAFETEVFYPDGTGTIVSTIYTTLGGNGKFNHDDVPFGVRSLTIYLPNKAAPVTTHGPIVFTIEKTHQPLVINIP